MSKLELKWYERKREHFELPGTVVLIETEPIVCSREKYRKNAGSGLCKIIERRRNEYERKREGIGTLLRRVYVSTIDTVRNNL